MSKRTFYIRTGDTLPSIQAKLYRSDGSVPDLEDATVDFYMMRARRLEFVGRGQHPEDHPFTEPYDDRQVIVDGITAEIVDESEAIVRYDWRTEDTEQVGTYWAEWVVTYENGSQETFPSGGYNQIVITRSVR